MTWQPNPTVCLNEIDFTGATVNLVTIQGGRNTVDEQPRAAYANIQLIVLDGSQPDITLNSCCRVEVENSEGSAVTVFKGFITDIQRQIVQVGADGYAVQFQVTAVSALARLIGFTAGSSYAKEFDGDRIYNILSDSILTSWAEVNPATTWATLDPALTWATFDGDNYVGTIERPGDYELTAYSGDPVEAASFAADAANSALGVLYELPNGSVNYRTASGRQAAAISETVSLPAAYVQGTGLSVASRLGDLFNEFTVTYKNDQTVADTRADSVTLYGRNGGSKSTQLENMGDAENQLDFFLDTRAYPRESLDQVTIPLHNSNLPNATRDSLLGAYCGLPLTIPDMPAAIKAGFTGFIEGYAWQFTRHTATLTAKVSDYQLSAIPQTWAQVTNTITWDSVDSALTWATAVYVKE